MKKQHTMIVGLGVTGMSCLRFLHTRDQITLIDSRPEPGLLDQAQNQFEGVRFNCGDISDDLFEGIDRLIVSPGVALDADFLEGARSRMIPMVSDIDLFLQAALVPVLGISGTNGKSTVTELCAHLLRGVGLKVGVGGNLGTAALDLLDSSNDVYVLELSSFQLERLCDKSKKTSKSDVFFAGCLLNISDDHLDRHGSMENYIAAKRRLIDLSRLNVYNREDLNTVPDAQGSGGASRNISFGSDQPERGQWGLTSDETESGDSRFLNFSGESFLSVSELKLSGIHNELNALAALAMASTMHRDHLDFKTPLRLFEGLAHRCQSVACGAEIQFINDSKATNVGACLAALEGLGNSSSKNIVLIAGGDAKGADLSVLKFAFTRFVKALIVMGQDAELLAAVACSPDVVHFAEAMSDAVETAFREASQGDVILLSPACSSLDMYTNFEARGADFVVNAQRMVASI